MSWQNLNPKNATHLNTASAFARFLIAAFGWLACLGGMGSVFYILARNPSAHMPLAVPGMDGAPSGIGAATKEVVIGEIFEFFDGQPGETQGFWPGFRGEGQTGVTSELLNPWPQGGPRVLWSLTLGEGYAAPAVANGCVFVLDYDEAKKADALRCFSLDNGREIWRRWYRVSVKRNHGMSRTVPATDGKYVVTLGPAGHAMCVEAATGVMRWGLDLTKDFGTEVPMWHCGQCPRIDNGVAIIAPGGRDLLLGVDCESGEIRWRSPNPRAWKMSHASVALATIEGKPMYIYSALGGMAGVSAQPGEEGKLLWETTEWSHSVIVPTPVVLRGGRIFVTAGYGAGGKLFRIIRNGDNYTAKLLDAWRPIGGANSEQQTSIAHEDRLYIVMPKSAGKYRAQLACFSVDDLRTPLWASGMGLTFGLGPYLMVGDKLLIVDDEGVLTMLQPGREGFEVLARAQAIPGGRDAWGPLAYANGRLLVRDATRLVCLELRQ